MALLTLLQYAELISSPFQISFEILNKTQISLAIDVFVEERKMSI